MHQIYFDISSSRVRDFEEMIHVIYHPCIVYSFVYLTAASIRSDSQISGKHSIVCHITEADKTHIKCSMECLRESQ